MTAREKVPPKGSFDYLLHPLRDDVWLEPPTPPRDEPPRPPRVTVNVEIVHRRSGPTTTSKGTGYVTTIVIATLLLGMLLFGCAHAESVTSYESGGTTYYQGTNTDGTSWQGTSYKSGGVTRLDFYGTDGKVKHCRQWQQGFTTYSECDHH